LPLSSSNNSLDILFLISISRIFNHCSNDFKKLEGFSQERDIIATELAIVSSVKANGINES
jgi:hypothetical protein